MSKTPHPRFVVGLILLVLLGTMALALQERRSVPLAAYSPVSPVEDAPSALDRMQPLLRPLRQVGTRAFWLRPWPWIAVGLLGFGVLAWGFIWGGHQRERAR